MELWTILGNIVLLLGACLFAGGVFSRFGQSPIVGYLLAGMILGGPGSLRLVSSEHEIEAISELGVALLLFSLGLEFSLTRLKKLGSKPLIAGAFQVVITILIVALTSILFGYNIKESVALGAMIALSSTAVVLRILMERAEMETPHGRNCLGVLLTQDIAVVPLALLMTILGGEGTTTEIALDVSRILLMTGGLIIGLFLLNKVAVIALGTLTLYRNRELTVVFAIVAGLGAAWSSHYVGISPALGAFIAGMLLGSSAFATQIRSDISALRIVLLTLFFGSAGMVASPIWIFENWDMVLFAVILVTFGKLLITWLIFIVLGQSFRVSISTALCLAQVGEFAFVLGSIGRASGVVATNTYMLIVSVAIVSFFISAMIVPNAMVIGNFLAKIFRQNISNNENLTQVSSPSDIAIIGFGPAGEIVAREFSDKGLSITILDLNKQSVLKAQNLGYRGYVGDATQTEVIEHARLNECKVIVISVPHHISSLTILENVRILAPEVHVIVRSRHDIHILDFVNAGASAVAGDEQEVGFKLALYLNEWLYENKTS